MVLFFVGGPLWREDGSVFCISCWPLPAQSFLRLSPLVLATIFYCLRFETSSRHSLAAVIIAFAQTTSRRKPDLTLSLSLSLMLQPTVSRPVCLEIKHPSGAYDQIFIEGMLMWGALSDERTSLSFTIAAGPSQRSHSRVRAQWDSRPYFTVSDLRLPISSPPTTRRVTVEVFDPASTRVFSRSNWLCLHVCLSLNPIFPYRIGNTSHGCIFRRNNLVT
jgi:hypothetical protein